MGIIADELPAGVGMAKEEANEGESGAEDLSRYVPARLADLLKSEISI